MENKKDVEKDVEAVEKEAIEKAVELLINKSPEEQDEELWKLTKKYNIVYVKLLSILNEKKAGNLKEEENPELIKSSWIPSKRNPLPNQFKKEELKFCRIRYGTKKPFEKDWVNKPYSWQEIEKFENENYGVLCGYGGLIVIDCDTEILKEQIIKSLPDTFTVKTGSGGTHFYYFCNEIEKKIILQDNEKHYGEVQAMGTQVVGPFSRHPTGNYYEILNDVPIVEITKMQLTPVVKPFIREIKEEEIKVLSELKDYGDSDINSISITKVMDLTGFKKAGNGEYYGINPWHGSSTGMNTWVNPSKNVLHCFRCNTGINVAKAIALNENIIQSCSDNLTKDDFLKVLKIAQEKYGLKKYEKEYDPIKKSSNIDWSEIAIQKFKIFDGAEKIYEIHIDGKILRMEGKEILDYNLFRLRYFEQFGVLLAPKRAINCIWSELVTSWFKDYHEYSKEKTETISDTEEAKELVLDYINNSIPSDKHILKEGIVCVIDDSIFLSTKIVKKLLRRNLLNISLRKLSYVLNDYLKEGSIPIRIENKRERFWRFDRRLFNLTKKKIKIINEKDEEDA